jgi:hypothetical protein
VLRLWDVASGACVRTIEVKEAVKAIVVHKALGVAYLSIQMREGGGGRVSISMLLHQGNICIRMPQPASQTRRSWRDRDVCRVC